MNRLKRRMLLLLWTVTIGYTVLIIAVFLFQRRLIYFPTYLSPALAETIAGRSGFNAWRAATGEILGWRMSATNEPTGTVLIFHGNAGCALDRVYLAQPIHDALSLDVIVVEYPGYGPRGGTPELTSILTAAAEIFATLPTNRPVYVVGESLGAGAAAHLARRFPGRIHGVTMFVPYDDLGDVAQSAFPILPAKWLLRDRFLPAEWLKEYRGPIQFVLAGADEVIPTKRGQALHDAYAGPKRLLIIPGARHNEVTEQTSEWWREVFAFFERSRSSADGR